MSFLDLMRGKKPPEFKPDPNAERLVSVAIIRDGETHTRGFKTHADLRRALGDKDPYTGTRGDREGFFTSEKRFVDRFEAGRIAARAGQLPPSWLNSGRKLLSSDISDW